MFGKTSFDYLQKENKDALRIKTFIRSLDDFLGGGIPSGIITEFCGAPGVGKTHMCSQLCIHVQLLGEDIKAAFIDTNQSFNPYNVKKFADYTAKTLNHGVESPEIVEEFLSNIDYTYCKNIGELRNAIFEIGKKIENKENIKLIVIDSFPCIFRGFEGSIRLRTQIIFELLTELQILADKFEIAVVITNELTTKILENNEVALNPSLGEAYGHKIGQRIVFEKGIAGRTMYLHKNLYGASVVISFLINDTGIRCIDWVP